LHTANYSFLDRLLHKLALEYSSIAEMSFDIDQARARVDMIEVASRRHVFVTGLARAGTTVLMREFHSTGLYRSLTYRDMPFVLAPNEWGRIASTSRATARNVERAHGDNVVVSVDSPESFDEVFWRVFCGKEYIHDTRLEPHRPTREVLNKYVRYVGAILAGEQLYLCKNNNNVLRLEAIRRAFPKALILVPFREPIQHAASLLQQHRRFTDLQGQDPFIKNYMRWLGHHEFGLDHRPFCLNENDVPQLSTDSVEYWLELWCRTYDWLERTAPDSVVFVCYEDLCVNESTWRSIADAAGIPPALSAAPSFRLGNRHEAVSAATPLGHAANEIYSRLAAKSRYLLAA